MVSFNLEPLTMLRHSIGSPLGAGMTIEAKTK